MIASVMVGLAPVNASPSCPNMDRANLGRANLGRANLGRANLGRAENRPATHAYGRTGCASVRRRSLRDRR
jgi:hypothetical protein